ncbi:enoyl-CoA hydratase/carnithine racemase [Herbihabitans rhizosphaerae]|uniref:Enoyl-CoA hydratase/carnithine racemase n=1 Tax=Herbihabitans rhizosphaerae TaxID=1872711 RepID=A0A4Q7KMK3_9PSEU|nr:crotonase/enoyl-CoA hydratase family protein [Herbihabitans rhizosphaerae]RZS37507.1 enoyl-CoA hydratase/carnithine racemase [Herbihabitans rhizosphaerae]
MGTRVEVRVSGGIAYATLSRPEKLNALDFEMFENLVIAAAEIRRNRDVRAVILRGEGDAFSSGLDFASVGKQPMRAARSFLRPPWRATNLYQRACWAWRELPVPVIAVVHGRCYGGGLQLALAADFRYTTTDCEFSVMEAKWGLVPDMTGTVTLRELVGLDVAKRLTMTAEIVDGAHAKDLGLVTDAVADPLAEAEKLAAEIATRSPDSVAATKALFHGTWHRSPRAAFRIESRLQRRLLLGPNHKIARKAGMAQRIPEFVRRRIR